MMAAPTPPAIIKGFRTRSLSEMNPNRITAMTLKPQFQLPRALPSWTEKPKTVVK